MSANDNMLENPIRENTAISAKRALSYKDNPGARDIGSPLDEKKTVHHVNLEKLKGAGIITPDSMSNIISEEVRHIKRTILNAAQRSDAAAPDNSNLIMVTSARPGEGKTFFALNLAMSIAMERDHTVLLVDGDVFNPSTSTMMDIKSGPGLSDCLIRSNVNIQDILIKTDIERLSLIPAGDVHPHITELIASGKMRQIMHELAMRYRDRIVIFDSPPLLATSLASVLASYMGQIIVMVEEGKTLQDELKEAIALLDTKKTAIGLVINKSRKASSSDYYYYRG